MNIIAAEIQNYSELFTSAESDVLRELREKTFAERGDKSMLSGFYQGRLLAMFSKLMNSRRILEIGTFMGYSALCLAEGLANDGKVITLDINPETNAIAREYWAKTPYHNKIEAHLGDALEIIPQFEDTFDVVFIDADKPNYLNYYNSVFPKLRIGGIILADNVLFSGRVLDAEKNSNPDTSAQALHEFNQQIQADKRVSNILLAIRDGLMLVRKETE